MATTQHSHDQNEQREQWLTERTRRLSAEDDFADGLNVLEQYPRFESRGLSLFEQDLRGWGFVYGLAFGLALSEWPDESHEAIAKLAFHPALMVYRRWGGEIEDPVAKREMAIRQVVERFEGADRDYDRGGKSMNTDLSAALSELADAARG